MTEIKNITDYLFDFTRINPDKPAFLHPKKITYQNFCRLVDLYASGVQKSGIKKGTKTIVLIKPGIDLFATTFALLRIGAIPVMIDPGMGTKAMARSLAKAEPEAFVGIPKSLLLKYAFPNKFKSVKTWISTGMNWIRGGKRLSAFRKLNHKSYTVADIGKNDDVAVFFTSGSTGPAKGVVYKNYMFEAQLNYLKNHFKYQPQEVDLCTFPLIGLFSVSLGLSVVLADMDMTRPATLKPQKLFDNINTFRCTFMFCSPMVLKKLAVYGQGKNRKLLSLKKVMTAGAPVTPELLQNFVKLLAETAEIHTPYGATEALPVTDIDNKELLEIYSKTEDYSNGICVGYSLENIDLRIIKITDTEIENIENANECSDGEVGEIIIRGENVTQNYFNNNQANRLSKIKDSINSFLWHRTGDLGRLDKKGRVWFYGRKSQRVITGGTTLFTIPVEAVFNRHRAVERSALVGVTKTGTTIPIVCIQLKHRFKKNRQMIAELQRMAEESGFFQNDVTLLFHKKFPVDPRHNAKIYREKLAEWAHSQWLR
ncbi:MAG: fatty acid CoA ligase family protein [Bacteroidota bacterium]